MNDIVNSAPVVIIAKSWCSICQMVVNKIDSNKLTSGKIKLVYLDTEFKPDQQTVMMNQLFTMSKSCTVPQLYVNGKYKGDSMAALRYLKGA